MKNYDLIIIGAGPAGLSAGLYAGRARLNTLIIEKQKNGGQIVITDEIENYPGCIEGETGPTLIDRMVKQTEKFGVDHVFDTVTDMDLTGDVKTVKCLHEEYSAKAVIIAAGANPVNIGCPGEKEFSGKGVSYCATCDGAFYKDKITAVNGGGDVAVEDAIFLARFCKKVYLIHRRDELRATKILQDELFALPNVEVIWDSVVKEIKGEDTVTGLHIENVKDHSESDITIDGIFVAIGIHPSTDLFLNVVECDEQGYVIAGEDGATSAPGIFVAGDSRKKRLRQIVTAVADGANAVTSVQDFMVGKEK